MEAREGGQRATRALWSRASELGPRWPIGGKKNKSRSSRPTVNPQNTHTHREREREEEEASQLRPSGLAAKRARPGRQSRRPLTWIPNSPSCRDERANPFHLGRSRRLPSGPISPACERSSCSTSGGTIRLRGGRHHIWPLADDRLRRVAPPATPLAGSGHHDEWWPPLAGLDAGFR